MITEPAIQPPTKVPAPANAERSTPLACIQFVARSSAPQPM